MRTRQSRPTEEWPSTRTLKILLPLLVTVVTAGGLVHGLPPAAEFALGTATGVSLVWILVLLSRLAPTGGLLRSRLGHRDR